MALGGNLHRVRSLLLAVADLSVDQRSRKLDQLCQGDPQLRRDVESLLEFDEDSSELFRTGGVLTNDAPPSDLPASANHQDHSSPLPKTQSQLIGQRVAHYRIEKLIGQGGMGEIFLAEDQNLDRKVAIKFLTRLRQSDPESEHRFMTEARAASALDHPNIGVIHEFGHTDTGQMYMVLGHHEGGSLRDLMDQGDRLDPPELANQPASPPKKKLGPDLAISLMIQVISGLNAAHQSGIIHRDLKPENIMLTTQAPEQATARIIDFGLAKLAGQEGITRTGSALGTMAYMSPEQIKGQEVDSQTDLFAAGVMLYELLTGRLPFDRETPAAMLLGILEDEPDPLPADMTHAIPEITSVVNRALAKTTEDRYQSATQMLADLEKILHQLSAGTAAWAGDPVRSNHWRPRTLGIAVLSVAALTSVLLLNPLGLNYRTGKSFTIDQAISPTLALYGTGGRVFGSMASGTGDVNGDGFADFIIGDSPNNALSTGSAYLYLGGETLNSNVDLIFQGETPEDHFGRLARAVADVNGDGFDDILVSARKFDSSRGRVYLFFGGAVMDSIPDVVFSGDKMRDHFGCSLAGACDLNGDGLGDIAIGMSRYSPKVSFAGVVAIYFGRPNHLWPTSLTLAEADLQLPGDRINQRLGTTLSGTGDFNHDGCDDLAVGLNGKSEVRIYFGGNADRPMDDQPDLILQPEGCRNLVPTPAGDVNGDGNDDLMLTVLQQNQGSVLVYFGGDETHPPNAEIDLVLTQPDDLGGRFGNDTAGLGDLNQDGFDDLLIGDMNRNQTGLSAGGAYLFLGGNPMNSGADAIFLGESEQDRLGACLAGVGDVNGDGKPDILIGAPGYDQDDFAFGDGNGAAYLFTLTPDSLP